MTLSSLLCHCFIGYLGCCLFLKPLCTVCSVSVVLRLSDLIAAVIRGGRQLRAELLSGELGHPGTAPLASLLAPSAFGEEPFGLVLCVA